MIQLFGSALKNIALAVLSGTLLTAPLLLAQPQSATKGAVLLVDTDDACRLLIDDEDKGLITPDKSQKFKVSLGEHILKCTVESVPDLVWRKVVEVKDSSQVAAVISLKALHVQYVQAASNVKTQKEQADAAASKQLEEAEAVEKQQLEAARRREEERAQFPQQMFEMVKGSWHGQEGGLAGGKIYSKGRRFRFDRTEGGLIFGVELGDVENDTIVLTPIGPNRFNVHSRQCLSTKWKKFQQPGATKDSEGYVECKNKALYYTDDSGAEYFLLRSVNVLEYHPWYETDPQYGSNITCDLTR